MACPDLEKSLIARAIIEKLGLKGNIIVKVIVKKYYNLEYIR